MDTYWLALFLILGVGIGFFAGLLGIGGGGLMVPALLALFSAMGFPDTHLMHLALGTSMAAIVPTAYASLRGHHKRAAVLWPVVRQFSPGVLVGTLAGTFLAAYLNALPLAIFFLCFMTFVALQMLFAVKPKAARPLPQPLVLAGVGAAIGGVSALVAIGGGTLTVPFLLWCNRPMAKAIGTSAAVGLPIAFAGAVGYALNGWQLEGLPAHCVGFIYWPAVVAIAAGSLISVPWGVACAHRLPVKLLQRCFAFLLLVLAAQMLVKVVSI